MIFVELPNVGTKSPDPFILMVICNLDLRVLPRALKDKHTFSLSDPSAKLLCTLHKFRSFETFEDLNQGIMRLIPVTFGCLRRRDGRKRTFFHGHVCLDLAACGCRTLVAKP